MTSLRVMTVENGFLSEISLCKLICNLKNFVDVLSRSLNHEETHWSEKEWVNRNALYWKFKLLKGSLSISSTNLRNSADLIEKLDNVDFSGERLVSYDITSLFTNVSVTVAISAIKESLKTIDDDKLPVYKRDYMQLVEKCIRFRSFRFKDQEYHLLDGLPMGSPLSAVAASLYLEMLERDHYLKIIPKDAHWFRYVDDCLLIFPAENNTSDIMSKLNEVVDNIQFTMENESLGRLPFLDTEIHRIVKPVLLTGSDVVYVV
ncbi:uncharacterized protein LOC143033532 [Oratosquilla oratoria]|uniref:uncharacterized protein LOC143033532 n=1 Tax=Oratosquilla oratoria TaxID=337810 RepID=UPI003F760291